MSNQHGPSETKKCDFYCVASFEQAKRLAEWNFRKSLGLVVPLEKDTTFR